MQIDHDPKTIEHIPNEKRPPKWIWKAAWVVVAIFWILQYFDGIQWDSLLVGLITGVVLVSWVADTAGLDVPESWRRKPPRR